MNPVPVSIETNSSLRKVDPKRKTTGGFFAVILKRSPRIKNGVDGYRASGGHRVWNSLIQSYLAVGTRVYSCEEGKIKMCENGVLNRFEHEINR